MQNILKEFFTTDPKLKWFYFNGILYMLLMVITTAYCYGRLDYQRSYATQTHTTDKEE